MSYIPCFMEALRHSSDVISLLHVCFWSSDITVAKVFSSLKDNICVHHLLQNLMGSFYSIFSFMRMFCRSLLVLLSFSFGHCVVWPTSIYDLPLWYLLQTLLELYKDLCKYFCSLNIFKMSGFFLFHLQKFILELIFSVECLFIKLQNMFLNFEVLA